jgi:hypothetical protein
MARVKRATTDALPFALIFLVFWLEWQTTARDLYVVRLQPSLLFLSVVEAFWHFDYLAFFNDVVYVSVSYRLIFAAAALAVGAFVFWALGRHKLEPPLPLPFALIETASAVGCLMLPVLAVEATGYGIPGEQWRKFYQFTIPFLYLSMIAVLFAILPVKAARLSWRISSASLAAIATAVTLGINRVQVEVTHNERLLRSALINLAQENLNEGHLPPYQFLVRRDPGFLWYSSDLLSPTYARTWALPPSTSFRFMPSASTSDPRLSLRYTEEGVENAALDGRIISNAHVFSVSATKEGVRRLCRVAPENVQAPVVEWRRSTTLVSRIGDCASESRSSP